MSESVTFEPQVETLGFEAEVSQLLKLVASSLYSNKEIFLRELISNASDAADKLRYQALSDSALYEGKGDLKIWIDFSREDRTLTIRDNGIGMSREEVVENLGTIAQSGTRAFRELLNQSNESEGAQQIGQFGVGFYSAFIVSEKVVVRSRRAGMKPEQGVEWESTGQGTFQVQNIHRSARGTEVVLHLKKEEEGFLDDFRLRNIINKYSDAIVLPIVMKKPPPPPKAEEKKDEADQDIIDVPEEEVVNSAKALWTLPKSEISEADYQGLYKHISHDFENALAWAHNKVEGSLEYVSLLYIPGKPPFDLWTREQRRGLKLYVKRVFIMDDAEHFMPLYLRFVKGVIDSNDLPLNISRELLQSNKVIDRIRSACVKRVLDLLEKMAEDKQEDYAKFWAAFGEVLKEGPAEDFSNKERIAKLLRFASTRHEGPEQSVSLQAYVDRMASDQETIYYLISDNFISAKNSPLLEIFRKKDIEVLLLTDRVDEWLVNSLSEFGGKSLKSVAQGSVDIGKEEDKEAEEERKSKEKDFDFLISVIKVALADQVKEVRLTDRLTDSPACVVFDENDMSGHMQRLLQAAGQPVTRALPILELNPEHALLQKVQPERDKSRIEQWSIVLLNQALLAEGEQLDNPARFVKEMNTLLTE